MDQHYYKLIEDYSKKNISNENLSDLMVWVGESGENQQAFREVLQAFETAEYYLSKPLNQQNGWLSIQQHISQEPKKAVPALKIRWQKWIKVAAAVVVLATVPLLYFYNQRKKQPIEIAYNEIYNPKGQKRLVTMPDGSNIYLNGDTKIRYTQNFNTGKRIVYLEGEAFFDVQHRVKQPFVVRTGKVSTTVLGTSFNVNAYKSLKNITVTVQTGKVGVVVKNQTKANQVYFLLPNEQLSISVDGKTVEKQTVDALEFNNWREYKMAFYDKTLEEIAQTIGREYDLDIQVKTEKLKKVKLTARFDKCSVLQIMEMISKLSGAKYTIYENKVIIY
ncbi:FecR family protein [Pedobacter nototheniae]|uniref:FecR family protein n=1 Tax=Pedobacter nototheniae TaxID=2488994 RepID=UPI00292F6010|nr:FecR domain-containing protein [Pedobacter nototheniae]